jgi:8-oxo-dGTP diphosphatase
MYSYDYPRPALTVDILLFTRQNNNLYVLLIERKHPPFKGCWALPGGFVDMDETLEHAAKRELHEETGISVNSLNMLNVFDEPGRDPRGRTVSVAYWAQVEQLIAPNAGDDAKEAQWMNIKQLNQVVLAFDHERIINTALKTMENL